MFWCKQFVFIHVSRTGGTMLTEAFGALNYISKDVHNNKHAPATFARNIVGDDIWSTARVFTVERANNEIAMSWYRHVATEYQQRSEADRRKCTDAWWDFVTMAGPLSPDIFFTQFPPPTMEQYCDLPNVERMTLRDAYDMLIQGLSYDPQIEIKER